MIYGLSYGKVCTVGACELTCLGLGSLMRHQYLKGFTLHLLILIHVLL